MIKLLWYHEIGQYFEKFLNLQDCLHTSLFTVWLSIVGVGCAGAGAL